MICMIWLSVLTYLFIWSLTFRLFSGWNITDNLVISAFWPLSLIPITVIEFMCRGERAARADDYRQSMYKAYDKLNRIKEEYDIPEEYF